MAIRRGPRPSDRFAQISNVALGDARLSYRARGVLAYLLSRPPGWETTSERLATQGREGRDAIRAALRELEQLGYLTRVRTHDKETGRWGYDQYVYDEPQEPQTDFQAQGVTSGNTMSPQASPETGNPAQGNPAQGNPAPGNPSVLPTAEGSKTEGSKTVRSKTGTKRGRAVGGATSPSVPSSTATEHPGTNPTTNSGDGSAAPRFPDQCAKHQDRPNAGADFVPCRGCMKASEAYEAAQDRAARRRPDWCGQCDEETRQLDGIDGVRRCPNCHPLARRELAGATS